MAEGSIAELGERARQFFVRDRLLQFEVVGTFALILALVAGAIALAYRTLDREAQDNLALNRTLKLVRQVDDLRFTGTDLSGLQTAYAFQIRRGQPNADSDSSLLRRAFLDARARFSRDVEQLSPEILTHEEARQLSAARALLREYVTLDEKIITDYRSGGRADISQANERVTYAQTILFTQIGYALTELSKSVTARADMVVRHAAGTMASTRLWIKRILVLSLLLSTLLAWMVLRLQRRRAELLRRLEEYARIDALTDVANRRAWDEMLPAALHRARRTGETLAVALIDLDHFKRFNDERGHQTGDSVLRELGALLKGSLRRDDFVARYGGEEFALLLHGCDLAQAQAWLNRLQERMPQAQTFSGGVLICDGRERDEAVIAAVDGALYRAKQAGRNRVEVASLVPPGTECGLRSAA